MADRRPELSIRGATLEDAVFIGQLLRRFYKSHGAIYGIPYDHESTLALVADTISRGIVLVGSASCAGALLIPFPYNNRFHVAQVVFWYVSAPRQIGIFDALLEECRRAGATHANAASLAPAFVGKRFYQARGLTLAEAQYLGPITSKGLH